MPKVSVVIPTYNRANYILEAIESVRQQTYQDYEIVVVDDGSRDNTREVLSDLIKKNAVHYIYQQNQGESSARNRGISQSNGEYIAFLDSDDLFLPTKLEKQAGYLDSDENVAFVHSWYSKFNNQGKDLGRRNTSSYSGWVYPGILLSWQVLISPSCVLVRSQVLKEVGGFDVDQYWGADLDLWCRITKHYPIALIPEVLTKVRVHPENLSASKIDSLMWFEKYLLKAFKEDPNLGLVFRKRAMAKMYTNVAQNLLGETSSNIISQTRKLSSKAILCWPFTPGAYLGLLASFLPQTLRLSLLAKFRSWRNPIRNES